jgi:branched-chain amino acid transport system permease protein
MYAGLAGVVLALAFRRIVPDTFGLLMAVEFLAMIVIGGLGSPGGAIAGAVFVSSLPAILQRYSASLPFLAETGSGGVTAGVAARFLYGAAIILVLLLEPGGLAAVASRLRRTVARVVRSRPPSPVDEAVPAPGPLAPTSPPST